MPGKRGRRSDKDAKPAAAPPQKRLITSYTAPRELSLADEDAQRGHGRRLIGEEDDEDHTQSMEKKAEDIDPEEAISEDEVRWAEREPSYIPHWNFYSIRIYGT